MTRENIFDIWAPRESRWSPWVKPVLFSFMSEMPFDTAASEPPPDWELSWLPPADGSTVLILDLPGAEAAASSIELARRGYRPVPLYNAIPWQPGPAASLEMEPPPVVNAAPIVQTLRRITPLLATENLVFLAPPAFLMDANRRTGSRSVSPGCFDNRSVSFPTDFPSANFLLAHGLRRAVLVQRFLDQPQSDLAHTLRAWQDAGIAIELKLLEKVGAPQPIQVPTPSWFGRCFYRALEMIGFQRSVLGGFGGVLPEASSG